MDPISWVVGMARHILLIRRYGLRRIFDTVIHCYRARLTTVTWSVSGGLKPELNECIQRSTRLIPAVNVQDGVRSNFEVP